jgi:hypothetical protein
MEGRTPVPPKRTSRRESGRQRTRLSMAFMNFLTCARIVESTVGLLSRTPH